jgi:hypothetical protein
MDNNSNNNSASTATNLNFYDFQNYDLDINRIYNEIISDIDAHRSRINIFSNNNQKIINSGKITDPSTLVQNLQGSVESTPQESRCHAFFRMIGLPVVNKDLTDFYNPGFDIDPFTPTTYKLRKDKDDKKIGIANNQIIGFSLFSYYREAYPLKVLNVFLNQNLDASVLALTSVKNRDFSAHLKNLSETYKDVNPTHHFYDANLKCGIIGNNPGLDFNTYIDNNTVGDKSGNIISGGVNSNNLFPKRSHIITPLFVDPIIDFVACPSIPPSSSTTSPYRNNDRAYLIGVPFSTKKNLLVANNKYADSPFIEKVIRDRMADKGNIDQALYGNVKKLLTDTAVSADIANSDLVKNVTASDSLVDKIRLNDFINIIRSMMRQLVDAQNIIYNVQKKYYYLPIPSKTGPEGGCSIHDPISTTLIANKKNTFMTPSDIAVLKAMIADQLAASQQMVATVNNSQKAPDDKYAFDGSKILSSITDNPAFGNLCQQNNQTLNNNRGAEISGANDALKTIEIIMGEFSGLGLCDIIAVIGALYTIPIKSLVSLLDNEARNRMNVVGINSSVGYDNSINDTMKTLYNYVKYFYDLMDKIYQKTVSTNTRTG